MRISDCSLDVCSSDLLFGKVPARRKFLRSARSEYAACADIVRRLAMARPDIGFTLEHDGRRNIAVQPGESRELRVAALTDRELADNHVMVALEREGVTVSGVAALDRKSTRLNSSH